MATVTFAFYDTPTGAAMEAQFEPPVTPETKLTPAQQFAIAVLDSIESGDFGNVYTTEGESNATH